MVRLGRFTDGLANRIGHVLLRVINDFLGEGLEMANAFAFQAAFCLFASKTSKACLRVRSVVAQLRREARETLCARAVAVRESPDSSILAADAARAGVYFRSCGTKLSQPAL